MVDTTSTTASLEGVGSDDQNDDDDDDDISRASLHGVGLASELRYDYADSVNDLRCARLNCNQPSCPACDTVLDAKKCWRDVFAEKQLAIICIYCPARKQGCQWIGRKILANEHVSTCAYILRECPNGCKQLISRSRLAQHLQELCELSVVQCRLCNETIRHEEEQRHLSTVCTKQPVKCHNNCSSSGLMLPRDELEDHLKVCSKRVTACPIDNCHKEMNPDEIEQHCENSVTEHISCVNDGYNALKTMVDSMRVSLEDQARKVRQQLDNEQSRLQALSESTRKSEEGMSELLTYTKIAQQQTLEQCYHSVDGLQKHIKENVSALEKLMTPLTEKLIKMEEIVSMQDIKIRQCESDLRSRRESDGVSQASQRQFNAHDKVISTHEVKLSEHSLRIDMLDCKSTSGVLLWKISDTRRRQRDAVSGKTLSIYSQPFYTSPNGYKMCARMFLNGDGMGRGTHLSLFFVLMRGEYDGLLPWPFQHKITLVLLNQNGGRHIADTFRPDPSSSSFMRPKNDVNVASGCPLFTPLATLDQDGYILNDSMFIKIIVDTASAFRPDARH
ncbi:TNF receptor-associated factor 3-like isoform X2 [Corticium candelabrum]|uniref:TNF receptor-associated factor 3-like isoform X2 n=1 Tax=Corticium candelabrum TaxID=121492 RepID=UPI002E259B6B|nr:TNF receptor-associated factor 3-like isoform X2 [Corticium candelabrum]